MGKADFSDEFKRDAVAQITEPGSATLELNDPVWGALLPDGLTPTECQLLAATAVGGPTGERPKLVVSCRGRIPRADPIPVVLDASVASQLPTFVNGHRHSVWTFAIVASTNCRIVFVRIHRPR